MVTSGWTRGWTSGGEASVLVEALGFDSETGLVLVSLVVRGYFVGSLVGGTGGSDSVFFDWGSGDWDGESRGGGEESEESVLDEHDDDEFDG